MATRVGAADLHPEDRKAELPQEGLPGRAAARIYRSLDNYERAVGGGLAFPGTFVFVVDMPHRRSFSPDAAFWSGKLPSGVPFLIGAPLFAVEVRSENDYGTEAEQALARERADYFAAGALVVWDVDVLRAQEIRVYRASHPDLPEVFWRGEWADAKPALLNWSLLVDDLLP